MKTSDTRDPTTIPRPATDSPRRVEIVGGGLAGLSLGLALRRAGVPVTLHEAGDYPRHRVCGEFIAGLDPATRRALRLDPFLVGARAHQEVAWFRGAAALQAHTLPATALAISRHTLDARIAEAFVAAGGELRSRSRASLDPAPGRVFAHGRHASPDSPWLGLKLHVHGLPLRADLEVHLGDHAYVGLCHVEEDRVNVCGLFRRRPDLALDRETALFAHLRAAGLGELADRIHSAEIDPDSHCAVAALSFGRAPDRSREGGERLVLGDAHALIPPFTGNGMTMAFQSAALALGPLLAWSRGESEWGLTVARVRGLLHARFRLRLATSALLHPALLKPGAQSGLAVAARAKLLPVGPLYHATH
jgi:2-polyprenyl-6-methoxyphenol hydroxylase-like FAD-dependent oxidoreductase